jgi:hypothetical protein
LHPERLLLLSLELEQALVLQRWDDVPTLLSLREECLAELQESDRDNPQVINAIETGARCESLLEGMRYDILLRARAGLQRKAAAEAFSGGGR